MQQSDAGARTAQLSVVMTTVATGEDADRIATALVEEHLAACCQSLPVASTYLWKGALCRESEVLLLVKTARASRAIARIHELHRYELPEIIALPVDSGHQPYLRWVMESCE